MDICITRYEITNGDHTYTVSQLPNSSGNVRWTIYRRLTAKANIPPFKQVFTDMGWQPVINRGGRRNIELFASIEEVIEEIQGDTR